MSAKSVVIVVGAVAASLIFAAHSNVRAMFSAAPPVTHLVVQTAPGVASNVVDTAVFAGGCFWGIEAVYEHVKGVLVSESGYSGGKVANPTYAEVSSDKTGHAEAVRVIFDPGLVSYDQLLQVFFTVAHDPTQLNRQGPDVGKQYRSVIFYRNDAQKSATETMIKRFTSAHAFKSAIVTQVVPLTAFFMAEDYHQDYMVHNPNSLYIMLNDAPKVEALKVQFAELYRD